MNFYVVHVEIVNINQLWCILAIPCISTRKRQKNETH